MLLLNQVAAFKGDLQATWAPQEGCRGDQRALTWRGAAAPHNFCWLLTAGEQVDARVRRKGDRKRGNKQKLKSES